MQQILQHAKGLYTNSSDLGGSMPDGALAIANDVVIGKDDLIEPRRGFDRSYAGLSNSSYRARSLFIYQNQMLCLDSGNILSYNTQSLSSTADTFTSAGSWTTVGTYAPPTSVRTRFAESNQNVYFTSSSGVYKMDAYTATPKLAGAYKGLDIQGSVVNITGNWLANGSYTVARALWGYKDANNNLILGAPSQREVVQNSAGATRAVNWIITIPAGVSTSWFFQVYRAKSDTVEPGDELGLVYEGIPTAGSFSTYSKTFVDAGVNTGTETITSTAHGFANGDMVQLTTTGTLPAGLSLNTTYYVIGVTTNTLQLSASYGGAAVNITAAAGGGTHTITGAQQLTFNDITPDSLRGATIYTAASQETISQANEQPPLAKDIAVYKGVAFYGNTTSKYRYYATLLSAAGLSNGNTITIGGVVYTAQATESVSSRQFAISASGTTSIAIRDTALSLCRVINQSSSSTVYAYYVSNPDDLPGKLLFEARSLGAAAFTVISSNTTVWYPSLATTQTATNDAFLNGLYFSKYAQPEAVPLSNYFFVGDARKAILRVLALRDSLFILKEDGIYRLSGEDSSSFRVDLLDNTAPLLAPESAVVLNNQIFALTYQGVVSITESGVAVRSRPIESTLTNLQGINGTVLATTSFGVAYESEREYILFVPTTAGDTGPSQAFVFNIFTNAWTRWVLSRTCGVVNVGGNNKLYLGNSADQYVAAERKTLTYTDYADYGGTTTISGTSGTTVTLSASDTISAGDIIYQSATLFGIVASVDSIAGTVTLQYAVTFANGAATIYKAISARVAWVPITGNNAGANKQFREVSFLFKRQFVGTGYAYFSSDTTPSLESDSLTGVVVGSWGLAPWGSGPWGGDAGRVPPRVYVPRNMQRCTQLTVEFRHSVAFSNWQLQGLAISGAFGSERVAV